MKLQAWAALLIILLQAVLFWYLSETIVFPILVMLISLPAVLWRRRWELSSAQLPFLDLVFAVLCAMKWYIAPHEMRMVTGFVMYPLVHAAAQFFLLAQVVRLWGRRPDRSLPVYLPLLAVLVFICLGDIDVTRRQRRMYQHATLTLAGLSCLYFALARRRQVDASSRSHVWVRPALTVAVLATTGFAARTGNAWLLDEWNELERLIMQSSAARGRPPRENAYVGFTPQAPLGSLEVLKSSLSNEVALRVVSHHEPGYLRGAVFDRFSGGSWEHQTDWQPVVFMREPLPSEIATRLRSSSAPQTAMPMFQLRPFISDTFRPMTIWRESVVEDFMFLPLAAKCVEAPLDKVSLDRHALMSVDNLPPTASVTAWIPLFGSQIVPEPLTQPTDWNPSQPFELSPEQSVMAEERLRQLPATIDSRVIELSSQLFRGCQTPQEKVQAVQRYFSRYRYQLGIEIPPGKGKDPLAYFLLERPAAHCEFFASGTAVLLRLGGIPCRYATGFAGGDFNPVGQYWIVRQHEAHAWVEAYLPDEGWVVVDTTPAAGVPAATETFSIWHLWDEINLRGQMIRASLAGGTLLGMLTAIKLFLLTLVTTIPGWLLTSGVLFLLARQIHIRRRPPCAAALPVTVIELQLLLKELDRRLSRWRLERDAHETLHQFAERLQGETLVRPMLTLAADWYLKYAATRYGPEPSEPACESLRRDLQQVCAGLTKSNRLPLSEEHSSGS